MVRAAAGAYLWSSRSPSLLLLLHLASSSECLLELAEMAAVGSCVLCWAFILADPRVEPPEHTRS